MKKIIVALILLLFLLPAWALALVNINTAGLEELDTITGVGPAIAQKIIDYRNTSGPFKIIEEIKNVSGIGDATFLKMKDQITIGSVSSASSTPGEIKGGEESSRGDGEETLSAHTGETSAEDYQKEAFKIGAGRERLATVRTPILFVASQNKKGKFENNFTWSFGDGTSATGLKVYHAFQFPGKYNVVLNGSVDKEEDAVSRATVIVSEAKIKITSFDLDLGYIEIANNSEKEQNLNSWILTAGSKKYVFPTDTIISPISSIKIPLAMIGFSDKNFKEITLAYPDGGVVSGVSLGGVSNSSKLAELKKQLAKVKQQIAINSPETSSRGAVSLAARLSSGNSSTKTVSGEEKNVVILKQEPNWLERIKNAIFK